ncbi:hypothetical protein T11_3222 [Trichinella zimbabwensis]|uniref:Uncharacterized protein n=1 Tax=Trichinella zimbabwensis TaxID=268475 RepID=A0A0V1GB48_9BILA|nr:hypothetical protein T11_3222 [Trichinella zimbabwensis]
MYTAKAQRNNASDVIDPTSFEAAHCPSRMRTAQATSPFSRWSCPQPIAACIPPRRRGITLATSSISRN